MIKINKLVPAPRCCYIYAKITRNVYNKQWIYFWLVENVCNNKTIDIPPKTLKAGGGRLTII